MPPKELCRARGQRPAALLVLQCHKGPWFHEFPYANSGSLVPMMPCCVTMDIWCHEVLQCHNGLPCSMSFHSVAMDFLDEHCHHGPLAPCSPAGSPWTPWFHEVLGVSPWSPWIHSVTMDHWIHVALLHHHSPLVPWDPRVPIDSLLPRHPKIAPSFHEKYKSFVETLRRSCLTHLGTSVCIQKRG